MTKLKSKYKVVKMKTMKNIRNMKNIKNRIKISNKEKKK